MTCSLLLAFLLILYSHIHPDSRGSDYDSLALCVHRLNCCILSGSAQEKRVQRTRMEENCERRPHSGNIAPLVSPFAVYILYCPVIHPFRSSPSQSVCPGNTKGVIASSRTRVNSHLWRLFVRLLRFLRATLVVYKWWRLVIRGNLKIILNIVFLQELQLPHLQLTRGEWELQCLLHDTSLAPATL